MQSITILCDPGVHFYPVTTAGAEQMKVTVGRAPKPGETLVDIEADAENLEDDDDDDSDPTGGDAAFLDDGDEPVVAGIHPGQVCGAAEPDPRPLKRGTCDSDDEVSMEPRKHSRPDDTNSDDEPVPGADIPTDERADAPDSDIPADMDHDEPAINFEPLIDLVSEQRDKTTMKKLAQRFAGSVRNCQTLGS